jgi:hypothetical protein
MLTRRPSGPCAAPDQRAVPRDAGVAVAREHRAEHDGGRALWDQRRRIHGKVSKVKSPTHPLTCVRLRASCQSHTLQADLSTTSSSPSTASPQVLPASFRCQHCSRLTLCELQASTRRHLKNTQSIFTPSSPCPQRRSSHCGCAHGRGLCSAFLRKNSKRGGTHRGGRNGCRNHHKQITSIVPRYEISVGYIEIKENVRCVKAVVHRDRSSTS